MKLIKHRSHSLLVILMALLLGLIPSVTQRGWFVNLNTVQIHISVLISVP